MSTAAPVQPNPTFHPLHFAIRVAKRVIPFGLAIYFFPKILVCCLCVGLLDVLRNQHRTLETLDRYFAGNGVFTWLLSPFNLFLDLLALPYRNQGVYKITDLPPDYQDEIRSIVETAHRSNLVGALEAKLGDSKRGMIFFKWYGKNLDTTVDVPEYHQSYKHIKTIGVSIFNKKACTAKHFGPLRVTLRVLYNINDMTDRAAFIQVGNRTHYWCDEKLFIFDDTLQHQSCNKTDGVRYCLFVDILRPSLMPGLFSAILSTIRFGLAPLNFLFYRHWKVLK